MDLSPSFQQCKKWSPLFSKLLPLGSKLSQLGTRWLSSKPSALDQALLKPENDKSDNSFTVYFDMQATTPLDPRVLREMIPMLTTNYGNPHSTTHKYGWNASSVVEKAREQIASLIQAQSKDIVFTSGATESNNIALKGAADFYQNKGKHIITLQTEHKCVLESCRFLERQDYSPGYHVTYLPVKKSGIVDLNLLSRSIRPPAAEHGSPQNSDGTVLVSVMAVNNEIGVIQPLKEIGKICRDKNVLFHTDAAQALGKIPLDVDDMNIDLMSMSSHKIYGPKGIGALFTRRHGPRRVRLTPLFSGGGQEFGVRSGTVPAPLAVGFGAACHIAKEDMHCDHQRILMLSKRLVDGITKQLPMVTWNGDPTHRYPGNINLSFAFVEGESLMMGMKNVAVSSGSACTSASLEPSYVLRALGVRDDLAHTSIRFGIGRFTTLSEVDYVIDQVVKNVKRLREMSPLWEMAQDGIDVEKIQWVQP